MKKILIYSETLLYLKGIDRLLKEGLSDINTTATSNIQSFRQLLHEETFDLMVVHFDFHDQKQINHVQLATQCINVDDGLLLILTEDTIAAGKLFPLTIDNTCFLDVKSSDKKITSTVIQMLEWKKNEHSL